DQVAGRAVTGIVEHFQADQLAAWRDAGDLLERQLHRGDLPLLVAEATVGHDRGARLCAEAGGWRPGQRRDVHLAGHDPGHVRAVPERVSESAAGAPREIVVGPLQTAAQLQVLVPLEMRVVPVNARVDDRPDDVLAEGREGGPGRVGLYGGA